MARIFISHSSADNAEALALRDWLAARGWDDLFLDIDPQRGLVSGQRWLERLQESAQRCKAVLFVLSRAWLASRYCIAEFWEARKQERPLFAVVIDETAVSEVPAEMSGVWQLAFLKKGSAFATFSVKPPPGYAAVEVRFSEEGLESLRFGLIHAGLTSFDTASFPWPALGFEHEADGATPRRPYRGLKPVDTPDAGVFFGRDAELVRARDHLAELRDRGGRQLVIILGASGSGKSSFLRAGLLPRLARDDRRFLPLPVLRPRGAALWGDEGLLTVLEVAHRRADLTITRSELRKDLEAGGSDFLRRLANLRSAAARGLPEEAKAPTLIVAVDQAEELFTAIRGETDAAEAALFLARMAELLRHGPETLALITIRSDAYEPLQTAESLAGIPQLPFNLPSLAAAGYRSVIEGPAQRVSDAGRPLTLEPGLTAALLADAQGADALPLLGFTLERLYVEHGGDGKLTFSDYDALGGVQGSIESAVAEAIAHPEASPQIPGDAAAREALLKRAFVPHLMGVNEVNGEPVRRTARLADLPAETRGLIDRLIDRRLLVIDRRVVDNGSEETVIEVGHEALLRRWPTLRRWHDHERTALEIQQEIGRAAAAWSQNRQSVDWLSHRGARLAEAEATALREDFAAVFSGIPRAYLDACRQAEDAARNAEVNRLARQRAMQWRVSALLIVLAIVTIVGGQVVATGQRELALHRSQLITANANEATRVGHYERAMRLALVASQGTSFTSPSVDAEIQLGRAAYFSQKVGLQGADTRVVILESEWATSAAFSPDGLRIVTASYRGTARIWSQGENGAWNGEVLQASKGRLTKASYSPDGTRIITASADGTIRVWSRGKDTAWAPTSLIGHTGWITSASFSPNGAYIVSSSEDESARVWSLNKAGQWTMTPFLQHKGTVDSATFSPDGTSILTASADGILRLWTQGAGRSWNSAHLAEYQAIVKSAAFSPDGTVKSAAFSPDGTRIVTTAEFSPLRLWSHGEDGAWVSRDLLEISFGGHRSASFSPDSTRIVTGASNGTVSVWSEGEDGTWTSVFLNAPAAQVNSAIFSPDGKHILTAALDGTRIWSIRWLMGPKDWARAEPLSLPETVCREKLHGSWTTVRDPNTGRSAQRIAERLLTAEDIRAAPLLAGREGEDVCEPFLEGRTWWSRLAFWR